MRVPNDVIRKQLDEALLEAELIDLTKAGEALPSNILKELNNWKFGAYGWTSPVNIMMTCAWYKWLHPEQDTCRIWAKDFNKQDIVGAFAVRSMDEKFTVPLIGKSRISENFCSPNSGMQGSRAIEKMRGNGRLDRDVELEQSVSFDMPLFQNIMNDINECSSDLARLIFIYFIALGVEKRNKRDLLQQEILKKSSGVNINLIDAVAFMENIKDPQFVKAFVAFFANHFVSKYRKEEGLTIQGVTGSKTASDARSKAPGDFWFANNRNEPIIAVEVKDPSKQIGFEIISATERRKTHNPTLRDYYIISAAKIAISDNNKQDRYWYANIARLQAIGLNVTAVSVYEFIGLIASDPDLMSNFSEEFTRILLETNDLKVDTLDKWQKYLENST